MLRLTFFLSYFLFALLSMPVLVRAASADEWRSRSIYQLITDRFAHADHSSPPCDIPSRKYCGGTWQGIISQLDYIQNMGFDAVWISPVVENINGTTAYGEAFHGYWTSDITTLNSHFGPPEDLKNLSEALHSRGMYLMVDVVVNHMASSTLPPKYPTSYRPPFNTSASFHDFCWITDYSNQTNVEQCWLGDKNVPLPDLDTEDEAVVDAMYEWIGGLVSENGIDGLRIDTVKHVRRDFWPGFASAAGVFTLGEVEINDTTYAAPYTEVIDSVLDYPTYYALFNAFSQPMGNLTGLIQTARDTQTQYKNGAFYTGSFSENQDQPRLQSVTTDQALVKNAMAWNFVTDGIPILYYGQEQGFTGGNDPDNREALWPSNYTLTVPLVDHVRALNTARKAAASYNSSFYTTPMSIFTDTKATMAISKPPLLALLSNVGNTTEVVWSVTNPGYAPNEELVEILTCTTATVDYQGSISAISAAGEPMVFLPRAALDGSGLCVSSMLASGVSRGHEGETMRSLGVSLLAAGFVIILNALQ